MLEKLNCFFCSTGKIVKALGWIDRICPTADGVGRFLNGFSAMQHASFFVFGAILLSGSGQLSAARALVSMSVSKAGSMAGKIDRQFAGFPCCSKQHRMQLGAKLEENSLSLNLPALIRTGKQQASWGWLIPAEGQLAGFCEGYAIYRLTSRI